jgi:predicted metal-dependent enzyme (double-stranded beta helix superfamily)
MSFAALQRLVEHLDAAVSGPADALAEGVTTALNAAVSEPEWLPADRRRASHDNYARHVLHGDAAGRFSILSIVWNPGQMSPIHAHHTWCGVAVYHGTLVETFFRTDAARAVPVAIRTIRRAARTLSFDRPLAAIHRIANEAAEPAISIHVYGVGRDRIASGVNRIYQEA